MREPVCGARQGPGVTRATTRVAVVSLVLAVAVGGCRSEGGSTADGSVSTVSTSPDCEAVEPERLNVEVVATVAHDPGAYTQGLVMDRGRLFESTGRRGESELRELDPATGDVLRSVELPAEHFGEGLALTGDGRLVQLTWQEQVAHVWDPDTFEPLGQYGYDGEGWGLATLGDSTLVQSDGSDRLVRRDPEDFDPLSTVTLERVGGPADLLNELEWDGTWLWANRYQSDELLRIDPDCGLVTGVADLGELRADATEKAGGDRIDVTNGIAHIGGTDRFLVTGKWWPSMYEVKIA